jgi:antitoxin YobK
VVLKQIVEIMYMLKNNVHFADRVTEKLVLEMENTLEVELPRSYKWFLKEFGQGNSEGIDIFGITKSRFVFSPDSTQYYREFGLPEKYVVVEECDDKSVYCLDTSRMNAEVECPVVSWSPEKREETVYFDSFTGYLVQRLIEINHLQDRISL